MWRTSLAGPVLACLLWHLALLAIYVARQKGDVTALACVSRYRAGHAPYERVTRPMGPTGHDGQFYYALARAPWQRHGDDLDVPAARHLRILYPLLCWLASGGDAALLFLVMPAVNLFLIAGQAGLAAWFARRLGRSPWWGLLLPIGTNASLSLLHHFTDALSTLAVLGLLIGWVLRCPGGVLAACSAVALFSREQNLPLVVLLLAAAWWRRRWPTAWGVLAVLALWLGWVGWLRWLYDCWPFLPGGGAFDWPLGGVYWRCQHLGGVGWFSWRLVVIHGASLLHLAALLGVAAWLASRERSGLVALTTLAGVALALVGGPMIYQDFWSYLRVFVWVPLGLWLTAVRGGPTWPVWLLLPGLAWGLVAARMYA
jgi:hypothetical protein